MTITRTSDLHEERLDHSAAVLGSLGARRLIDLGCGLGALIYRLLQQPRLTEIVGLERSALNLSSARAMLSEHLHGDQPRLRLICGSFTERHEALTGFDAAAMIETIEHVPRKALSAVEATVFGYYRPRTLYMTTPNQEYNVLLGLAPGELRDPDHTFEWSRSKFRAWASGVARRHGYAVRFGGIGEDDPELGPPTQTALFSLLS